MTSNTSRSNNTPFPIPDTSSPSRKAPSRTTGSAEIFRIHALQKCFCCVSCKRFPPFVYLNQKINDPPNSRYRGRFLVQQLGGRVFVFETLQTHTRMGRSVFPLQNEDKGTVFLGLLATRLTGLHAFRLMYFKRALSLAYNRVRGFVHKQDLIIGNLTTPVTFCVQNRRLRELDSRRDRCSTHPFTRRDALSVFSAVADLRLDGPC